MQAVGGEMGVGSGVQLGAENTIGMGQGAVTKHFEMFALRMMHQFPANHTAHVCMGLSLRRHWLLSSTTPAPRVKRRQIEKVGQCFLRS